MNWRELAAARGLDIPDEQIDRIAPALEALEAAFRPLLKPLEPQTEPAFVVPEERP